LSDNEKMACVLLVASYARAVGGVQGSIADAGTPPEEASGASYAPVLASLITPDRFPDLAPVVASGAYTSDEYDDFGFGLERVLDGIQRYIDTGDSGGGAAKPTADDAESRDVALYGSDKRVRETAKVRREAERALRDARRRERDALRAARDRAGIAKGKASR
jgi:hypothetical protein